MPEALLTDVEEFAGSNDKGPWLKYTLKDGQGQAIAATFDSQLGAVAKSLIGSLVVVTTKAASNPKYAPTLVSIEASANGAFTPPPEPAHKPVVGGDKDRAIARMACLKAASERQVFSSEEDWALEVMRAAARFEQWVYRDIDDAPFQ